MKGKDNWKIYHRIPTKQMDDQSQSGFEFELAKALCCVGASDDELVAVYEVWCHKHGLMAKKRFVSHVIPDAREATANYVADWEAKQPKRRKHGTTDGEIIAAIRDGVTQSKEIAKATGLKYGTVRSHVSRMLRSGKLLKTLSGYAVPDVSRPVDEPVERGDALGTPRSDIAS